MDRNAIERRARSGPKANKKNITERSNGIHNHSTLITMKKASILFAQS